MQRIQRYSRLGRVALARASSRHRTCSKGETPLRRLLDDASTFGEGRRDEPDPEPELRWATQPYSVPPPGAAPSPGGSELDARTDPRDTSVVLFPGQGSQHVGMGLQLRDIPAARELYDLASNVVGWDVWGVCTRGPAAELEARCQTCVVVTSLAALERARERRRGAVERARAAAGFSLGEVSALVFARALRLESALRLVEVRAAAMRAASAERAGGMLTVWLAPDARLGELLRGAREEAEERGVPGPVCEVANYLYPGCKVLAGDEQALAWVERCGGALGVRRSARVRVAGAFHCALMARAAHAVRAAAAAAQPAAPALTVVSGVSGRALRSGAAVERALGAAVAAPVRWEQALHALYARPGGERFPVTLALGPGGTLRATLRQVNARAWDSSLQIDV